MKKRQVSITSARLFRPLTSGLFLAFLLIAHRASAEMVLPSQVTPQNLDLRKPDEPHGVTISPSMGKAAPPGADTMHLRISHVVLEGGLADVTAETAAVVATIENRDVSVATIYATARRLEQVYARAGYVLARVVVPPQRLREGRPVRLSVIDGFIEAVQVDGVPERMRRIVAARAATLVGRRHLKLDEIERVVLIAGDAPGLQLKSALAPGKMEGGTLLILEGESHLVNGMLGTDNSLPASLGRWEWSGSLAVNGLLGLGEQTYLSVGSGFTRGGRNFIDPSLGLLGVGIVLPVGTDGWTVNPEYVHSSTHPTSSGSGLDSLGSFDRFSIDVAAPLIWTRFQKLKLTGTFEHIDQSTHLAGFDTPLNRDNYAVVREDLNWQRPLWQGAQLDAGLQISQGLGGRDQTDANNTAIPLSRQGTSPYFSKINGHFLITQALPNDFRLEAVGRAQISFSQPLFVSEQFALDGPQGVTAMSSGAFNVDAGATFRAELGRMFQFDTPLVAASYEPYVFGAGGWGRIFQPTAVEQPHLGVWAGGIGLRGSLEREDRPPVALQVEVARRYSDLPSLPAATVVSVTASLRF